MTFIKNKTVVNNSGLCTFSFGSCFLCVRLKGTIEDLTEQVKVLEKSIIGWVCHCCMFQVTFHTSCSYRLRHSAKERLKAKDKKGVS